MKYNFKQIIVVRTDLAMSKGKTAVQVAHGSLSSYVKTKKHYPDWADNWFKEGQKKIAVKVKSEDEILQLADLAKKNNIPFAIINDAGLTQLPPGTITVVGLGPSREEILDKICGDLSLL